MALNATFDSVLSRVRLSATGLTDGTTALFERSTNNIYWTTVRGGSAVTINGSDEASLDDYEFIPNQVNYYRVSDDSNTFTTSLTPSQSGVWFKSITRPFLNRPVSVVDFSDVTRPSRTGIFQAIGSSYPIAISMVPASRRWTMTVKADSISDADALDLVFASGDPLYIQTDGTNDIPGGYVAIGDTARSKFQHQSQRRWFEVPMTEIRAPGPDVVGSTSTWESLVAEFGSWTAVLANFGSWTAVVEYVSDPSTVIVP